MSNGQRRQGGVRGGKTACFKGKPKCVMNGFECPNHMNRWLDTEKQGSDSPLKPSSAERIAAILSTSGPRIGCNGAGGQSHVSGMGIVVQSDRLRLEMARRGWTASILAREAGISPPTVSAAMAGKPIAAQSLGLIAAAFGRVPALPTIDALIAGVGTEPDLG